MEEIWIKINDYENYSISNYGNIRNDKTGNILKGKISMYGYIEIHLDKNKIRKYYRLHRLIAIHFIPNPNNKSEIDHIDGNKNNNHISNLRWSTRSENSRNRGICKLNTSSIKGVSFDKRCNKWRVAICQTYLGRFNTLEEAQEIRQKAAQEIFGEFVNDCEKV